ncbi:heme-copper oxidase subunit III [Synechococcales cyanobacterium C]|uniref:Oxidase aa(3) subunit 3 n=1 Tax=Petrachloros mirabilis ULC683 TaxID=2781853 RepID=A0A8K2A129_9CYAN|nr:heme-copper oxidase subunit III [Petrachloros mirabilis]NCJ07843.1 heme-copper oxidase subunit III [Petrachloros mirabilis ULC683]
MQGSTVTQSQAELNFSATHSHQIDHHSEHPDHRLFGFVLFLISESMLFVGLFVAYLTYRAVAPVWPPAGTPEVELLLPSINTVILLSSSFVIHQADGAIKKNDVKGMQLWFLATIAMGATFLAGQVYEYAHLEFGLAEGNLFGSTFYVLTGFHGLHVFVGLLLMSLVLWRSRRRGHYSDQKHFGVEATEIYWHFVDVIWIFLFSMLYLLH